ncbi:radical SAM protein [Cutibacterium sp.]|uniref:radical SAM/SPASM domain-containing protein n=1 Tax=Cutibacterium sp. TaxID=1912221 RepID=UPI0026DB9610|nr:radical SAM protein [Cutibacterium sp.]MDO4413139.1 radical SAM protein [Cutibacterium sp.]
MARFHSSAALELYRQIQNRVHHQHTNYDDTPHKPEELVLNISKGCNLKCPYCFANAGLYGSNTSSWMTESDAYNFTLQMLHAHPTIHRIKLFGGEPFMNIPAMEGCAQAVQEFSNETTPQRNQVSIGCVTNMTIYSARISCLAHKINLHITASIDGPIEIHDKNRRFRNGKGSYNRIKANIKRYRDAGVNIAGIECVYSPAHMDSGISILALHDFLVDEFDSPGVIITPLQASLEDKHQEAKFTHWIRTCAEEYLREAVRLKDRHESYKSVMDEQMRIIFAHPSNLGWCGLGTTTLTVDVDGSILPCYTLLHDKDKWRMGSLSRHAPADIHANKSIAVKLRNANPRTTQFCSSCDIREVCRGCPGGIFAMNGNFTGIDPVGCAYRIGALEGLLTGWINEPKKS